MSEPFDVVIQDAAAMAIMDRLIERGTDLQPALREIGEDWLALTKRAFATSTSPWGERWAPNAESTILAYVRAFSGSFSKKTGRLTKSGAARVMGKKPLIGESRALSTTTYYDVSGNSLVFASPQEYAAIQNFGGEALTCQMLGQGGLFGLGRSRRTEREGLGRRRRDRRPAPGGPPRWRRR